jgi:hypothetical protein
VYSDGYWILSKRRSPVSGLIIGVLVGADATFQEWRDAVADVMDEYRKINGSYDDEFPLDPGL